MGVPHGICKFLDVLRCFWGKLQAFLPPYLCVGVGQFKEAQGSHHTIQNLECFLQYLARCFRCHRSCHWD